MKNDMQIQQDVLAELSHQGNVMSDAIGVEVHHGVVKLAGSVSDAETKKTAEMAASGIEGVSTVVMDIDVAGAGARPAKVL
jgi:osmotically-inducible protein OsmY